ncbi:hypothetical protein [uncultured Polaribacter sp.]|uniref:hypothetical protein n=1 Tax=uncultured Polaribacter sp. TaxID=174711 RepID=UPI003451A37F
MCKCPSCSSGLSRRLVRTFFLKLIPKAKLYKCHKCKTKFINIPYLFTSIKLKSGHIQEFCSTE